MRAIFLTCGLAVALSSSLASAAPVEVGVRPQFLVSQIRNPDLKAKLAACLDRPQERKLFSIAHRGAPLQFAEHTAESYAAAHRMGAGI